MPVLAPISRIRPSSFERVALAQENHLNKLLDRGGIRDL